MNYDIPECGDYSRLSGIPVLSEDQEREAFERMAIAPPEEAKRLRDQLVVHNIRLAFYLIGMFGKSSEESTSDALCVLLDCVDKFDHTRGVRFSTYFSRALRNKLFSRVKVHEYPMDPTKLDVAQASENPDFLAEDIIEQAPSILGNRDWSILSRNLGIGEAEPITFKEIGKAEGVSKSRVAFIAAKARLQLAEAFQESA